jgi:hypothetical protein
MSGKSQVDSVFLVIAAVAGGVALASATLLVLILQAPEIDIADYGKFEWGAWVGAGTGAATAVAFLALFGRGRRSYRRLGGGFGWTSLGLAIAVVISTVVVDGIPLLLSSGSDPFFDLGTTAQGRRVVDRETWWNQYHGQVFVLDGPVAVWVADYDSKVNHRGMRAKVVESGDSLTVTWSDGTTVAAKLPTSVR